MTLIDKSCLLGEAEGITTDGCKLNKFATVFQWNGDF